MLLAVISVIKCIDLLRVNHRDDKTAVTRSAVWIGKEEGVLKD